jgi:ribosomal protein S19E (S16A)
LARIHKIKGGVSTISYEARLEARLNVQMWNIQDERLPRAETAAPELPAPDTERWTPRRKASVVKAVLSGVMGLEEICHRYGLSVEEFSSWNDAMHKHGMRGLYTTKLQKYRYFPTRSLL